MIELETFLFSLSHVCLMLLLYCLTTRFLADRVSANSGCAICSATDHLPGCGVWAYADHQKLSSDPRYLIPGVAARPFFISQSTEVSGSTRRPDPIRRSGKGNPPYLLLD